MKLFIFLVCAITFSSVAKADVQRISFEEFKEAAVSASAHFRDENCTFQVQQRGDNLRLVLKIDLEDMVILNLNPDSMIFSARATQFDGSFQYVFQLKDIGESTLTHVDDSYDKLELSDGSYKANCRVVY